MSECERVSPGPEAAEHLLACAGLTEREADAVRAVALGMTAAEVAPLMGVSASTVGSFRQRAYAKLGVEGRAEFLRLPAVAAWRRELAEASEARAMIPAPPATSDGAAGPQSCEPVSTSVQSAGGASEGDPSDEGVACSETVTSDNVPAHGEKGAARGGMGLVFAFLGIVFLSALLLMLFSRTSSSDFGSYLTSPNGVVETEAGEVPDVTGMRADGAAGALSTEGICPVFVPRVDEAPSGTVLGLGNAGAIDELEMDTSSFSWGTGCTAIYDVRHGNWRFYVELIVAV